MGDCLDGDFTPDEMERLGKERSDMGELEDCSCEGCRQEENERRNKEEERAEMLDTYSDPIIAPPKSPSEPGRQEEIFKESDYRTAALVGLPLPEQVDLLTRENEELKRKIKATNRESREVRRELFEITLKDLKKDIKEFAKTTKQEFKIELHPKMELTYYMGEVRKGFLGRLRGRRKGWTSLTKQKIASQKTMLNVLVFSDIDPVEFEEVTRKKLTDFFKENTPPVVSSKKKKKKRSWTVSIEF